MADLSADNIQQSTTNSNTSTFEARNQQDSISIARNNISGPALNCAYLAPPGSNSLIRQEVGTSLKTRQRASAKARKLSHLLRQVRRCLDVSLILPGTERVIYLYKHINPHKHTHTSITSIMLGLDWLL